MCDAGYTREADTSPATSAKPCSLAMCDGTTAVCGCALNHAVLLGTLDKLACEKCAAGYVRPADSTPVKAAAACTVRQCDGTNALCGCKANVAVTLAGGFLNCSTTACADGYDRAVDTAPVTKAQTCTVKQCDGTTKFCGCSKGESVVAAKDGTLTCNKCDTGYDRDADATPVKSAQKCTLIACDGSNGACGCAENEFVAATGKNRLDCGSCAAGWARAADSTPTTKAVECGVKQCDGTDVLCGCKVNTAIEEKGGNLTCAAETCAVGTYRIQDLAPVAFPSACIKRPCTPTSVANSKKYTLVASIAGKTGDKVSVACANGYNGGGEWTCNGDAGGGKGSFTGAVCKPNVCTLPTEPPAGYTVKNPDIKCESMATGSIVCSVQPVCSAGYEGTPTDKDHSCDSDGAVLKIGGCVAKLCADYACPAGKATVDPNALQTAKPETICCADDCNTAFKGTCDAGSHMIGSNSGSTKEKCCVEDITKQCRANTISACTDGKTNCKDPIADVVCDVGTHPKAAGTLRTDIGGRDPTSTANKAACCTADIKNLCKGNSVSGIFGQYPARPNIVCGSGRRLTSRTTSTNSTMRPGTIGWWLQEQKVRCLTSCL